MTKLGVIDVGTNSIHLLIGTVDLAGRFHVTRKERDLTRLGAGGFASGTLTQAAMDRAMTVLERYAAALKRRGVDCVEAVATSAVREASNGLTFARRVRTRLGLPLRIISGRQEAQLIALGVLHSQRLRRPALLITIGGGSAQVIHAEPSRLRYLTSVPLGCARLAQQFIHHDPPLAEEAQALFAHARRVWRPVALALRRVRRRQALGCSATIEQLILAAYLRSHRRLPQGNRGVSMSRGVLRQLISWLLTSTARERMHLLGLDPRREDLALPTGVTLLTWMEACGVSSVRHVPGSLREGLVVDHFLDHRRRRASLAALGGGP